MPYLQPMRRQSPPPNPHKHDADYVKSRLRPAAELLNAGDGPEFPCLWPGCNCDAGLNALCGEHMQLLETGTATQKALAKEKIEFAIQVRATPKNVASYRR